MHVNRPVSGRRYPLGAMARVLVIDDEPDVRWLIRMSLERAGHEVIDAEDGLRGIALAMKQRLEKPFDPDQLAAELAELLHPS